MKANVNRTQKDLLFVIHTLKLLAKTTGNFWQAVYISEKIANWLYRESGCEVWPCEPAQYQQQTGERKYYILYEFPHPGTLSMELYNFAHQCHEEQIELEEFS